MKWSNNVDGDISALCVKHDATLFEAMQVIDAGGEAIAFVCDSSERVVGSLTDGDVRRAILGGAELQHRCLASAMRRDFAAVSPQADRAEVLDVMRARDIGQLPILDTSGRLRGLHTIGQLLSVERRQNTAVILAGGRGTRLHPLTQNLPKPMVAVAGRPILERIVLHLMSCGIRNFRLSVNYLAHIIEDYFGDGSRFGCSIEYLREDRPLGTGGPLSLLEPVPDLPIVVMNGDLLTQCDVGRMLRFHEAGEFVATFGVKRHQIDIPFGVAEVDGDRLLELREKPAVSMLINAGIYVISPEAVRLVPRGEEFPITNLFAHCLCEGSSVGAFRVEDEWIDIGHHDELRRANGET